VQLVGRQNAGKKKKSFLFLLKSQAVWDYLSIFYEGSYIHCITGCD